MSKELHHCDRKNKVETIKVNYNDPGDPHRKTTPPRPQSSSGGNNNNIISRAPSVILQFWSNDKNPPTRVCTCRDHNLLAQKRPCRTTSRSARASLSLARASHICARITWRYNFYMRRASRTSGEVHTYTFYHRTKVRLIGADVKRLLHTRAAGWIITASRGYASSRESPRGYAIGEETGKCAPYLVDVSSYTF